MTRTRPRLLLLLSIAGLLGLATLVAVSLIGWSSDVDATAFERVEAEGGLFAIAAIAGGCAGLALAWAFTNRALLVAFGAVAGLIPAVTKASAYFTNAY